MRKGFALFVAFATMFAASAVAVGGEHVRIASYWRAEAPGGGVGCIDDPSLAVSEDGVVTITDQTPFFVQHGWALYESGSRNFTGKKDAYDFFLTITKQDDATFALPGGIESYAQHFEVEETIECNGFTVDVVNRVGKYTFDSGTFDPGTYVLEGTWTMPCNKAKELDIIPSDDPCAGGEAVPLSIGGEPRTVIVESSS